LEINMAVESFEVTRGKPSGDLLSEKGVGPGPKIGFLATAYFEYFRMYSKIKAECTRDMQRVAGRLAAKHEIVYPGLVTTLDESDKAGKLFSDTKIDLLIVTESTYTTDYMIHQVLHHLPSDIPILIYVSQMHDRINFKSTYEAALRNSGPMALMQLVCGFKKMKKYSHFEVVVGSIHDDETYGEIDRFIRVLTTIKELKNWTIGVIGHVFRGMYDFQYDKTALEGKLGPHVLELQSAHLNTIMEEFPPEHKSVSELKAMVYRDYDIRVLDDEEVTRAAHLAVSLVEVVHRYRIDGLALLGQHYIERLFNSTCHLGVSEILRTDRALAVTEGDVLGLTMCKVLKDFTGHTPFFGEWEEFDCELNALLLLGHGFVDPRTVKEKKPIVVPFCEQWGFKGNGFAFQASFKPGPVTMSHLSHDAEGWRILITGGEALDMPRFEQWGESAMVVRVDKPVKEYFRELIKLGFPHHAITVYGDVRDTLQIFAEQLGLKPCRI
jgi:L-arabinose isomerase